MSERRFTISNGTMGEYFHERWCYGCHWDHAFSHTPDGPSGADLDPEKQCGILLALTCGESVNTAMVNDGGDASWPASTTCHHYKPCEQGACKPDPRRGPAQAKAEVHPSLVEAMA